MEDINIIDIFIKELESKKIDKHLVDIIKKIKEYIEELNKIDSDKIKKIKATLEKKAIDKNFFCNESKNLNKYQAYDAINKEVESISEFTSIIKKIVYDTQYNKLKILKNVVDNIVNVKYGDTKNIFEPIEKSAPKEIVDNIECIYYIKKKVEENKDLDCIYDKKAIWCKLIDIEKSIDDYKKNHRKSNKQVTTINNVYIKSKKELEFEIFFRASSNKTASEYFDFTKNVGNKAQILRGSNYWIETYEILKDLVEHEKTSLFSNTNLSGNERLIYKDFLASNPNEFENMTTFDILTKMRHYEVPNRLLDVTLDPLLALYFACGNDKNKGSETIFVYIVKKQNIKYYDSDTVTVLSVLTKLKKEQKEKLKKIVDIFKKKNGEYYKSKDKIDLVYKKKTIKFHKNKSNKYIDEIINTIKDIDIKQYEQLKIKQSKKSKVTVKDWFNFLVSKIVSELNWQLKREIPGWYEGFFDLETFTQCYLVKPKMNNPRIIAQSGAFFIYPFEHIDIAKSLEIHPELNKTIFKIDTTKISEELDRLNIDSTKFFPDDLVKYKEEITDRYVVRN